MKHSRCSTEPQPSLKLGMHLEIRDQFACRGMFGLQPPQPPISFSIPSHYCFSSPQLNSLHSLLFSPIRKSSTPYQIYQSGFEENPSFQNASLLRTPSRLRRNGPDGISSRYTNTYTVQHHVICGGSSYYGTKHCSHDSYHHRPI